MSSLWFIFFQIYGIVHDSDGVSFSTPPSVVQILNSLVHILAGCTLATRIHKSVHRKGQSRVWINMRVVTGRAYGVKKTNQYTSQSQDHNVLCEL